ncbi:MAG: DUF3788 family protein [bacterium]
MERPILTDKAQYPTEEVIDSHIGNSRKLWFSFFEYIHTNHPDFSEEWKYYNDGKSWLLKVTRKSKTIFWLSILKDTFRTTFYLSDKAEPAIFNSAISDELKEQFRNGKRYNKIRDLTIIFKSTKDIEYANLNYSPRINTEQHR